MKLKLSEIKTDGGTQTRQKLDSEIIKNYSDQMLNEIKFPDIITFYDGTHYWLADGFHRVQASFLAGFTDIESEIKQGTRRDAILYSVGANSAHGLPRTNADKRISVMTLLEDEEWSKWSDREIARRCCVDNSFVSKLRSICGLTTDTATRKVERNGIIYAQNTQNIGKQKERVTEISDNIEIPDNIRAGEDIPQSNKKEIQKIYEEENQERVSVEVYDFSIQIISFIDKKVSVLDVNSEIEVYDKIILSLQNKIKKLRG